MGSWFRRLLLVGLAIAVAEGLASPAAAQQAPAPREQAPRVPADVQAAGLLHQTYDNLTLVRVWMSSDRARLPEDQARLADQAEELYRTAHKAYKDGDYARATGLAVAAADAAHGLMSALHAVTKPVAGLPPPPDFPLPTGDRPPDAATPAGRPAPARTPQDAAREVLRAAREGIVAAEKTLPDKGPARSFIDAARTVYEQGRQAYEKGNYRTAIDLGAAAEAWARVGDDLKRVERGERPGQARPPQP
jgi:hypothetical protein